MKEVRVRLGTALFNAGIVGLIRILESGGIIDGNDIKGDEIVINAEALGAADLAELYIVETVKKFRDFTVLHSNQKTLQRLADVAEPTAPDDRKKYFSDCKDVAKAFTKASLKTGFASLNADGVKVDITENAEALSRATDFNEAKTRLRRICNDWQTPSVRQTSYMKDISYTKIRMIWDGISFLSRQSTDSIKTSFDKVFVQPLKEMLKADGGKKPCACCGIKYDKQESLSFINDIGVDAARKKSPFWNYKFDLGVCPLCRFIYACAPIGFSPLRQDLVFVNGNGSLNELQSVNAKLEWNEIDRPSHYGFIVKVLQEVAVKERELHNIEVVVRHGGDGRNYYTLDIIDKRLIKVFADTKKEFEEILKFGEYGTGVKLAEQTLRCLFNNQALWESIDRFIKTGVSAYLIWQLLIIQIKRKGEDNMSEKMGRLNYLWNEGNAIKRYYESGSNNENKLRGTVIKLQNAIRAEDTGLFYDILIRLYMGIGHDIPDVFLRPLTDSETFREVGTAFVLGVLGQSKYGTDKAE